MKISKSMPTVDAGTDFRAVITRARQAASIESRRAQDGRLCRRVVIILPSREIALQECQPSGSANKEMIEGVEKILPSGSPSNVIAIAFTDLKASSNTREVSQAMPFLGFLLGFAYIGHNVVAFEGHSSALAEGLAEADLLLADARMIPFLQKDWRDVAFTVMRTPKVFVHQPNGQVQQIVRNAAQ